MGLKELICDVVDFTEKKAKKLGYEFVLHDIYVDKVLVELCCKVISYDGDGDFDVQYDKYEGVTNVWINNLAEGWTYLETNSGRWYLIVWKNGVIVVGYLYKGAS